LGLFVADWIVSRKDMTFDHGFDLKDSDEARARAEGVLSTLCDVTSNGIKPEVPRMFSQLVEAAKKMSRADLRDVFGQLQRSQICSANADRAKYVYSYLLLNLNFLLKVQSHVRLRLNHAMYISYYQCTPNLY
jgi:hypothetical protein